MKMNLKTVGAARQVVATFSVRELRLLGDAGSLLRLIGHHMTDGDAANAADLIEVVLKKFSEEQEVTDGAK
jgi:hypothetical protein